MGKSLSSDSARARSQKQKEASRRAAPDAQERIPTRAGGVARSYHFYGASKKPYSMEPTGRRGRLV